MTEQTFVEIIDIGEDVICDQCNDDYTNSDEQGGLLIGGYAYCPNCAVEAYRKSVEYGETDRIEGVCPDGTTFRDWVLKIRNGNNTIKITE